MKYAIAICLLLGSADAQAHSWYPWDCCHDDDCAPADRVDAVSTEFMVVTSKHGTAFVPASMPRRDSQDGRVHICMRKTDTGMSPICVFLPPTN